MGAALIALGGAAWLTHVRADPRATALTLESPAGSDCPTRDELATRVERQLGRPLRDADTAALRTVRVRFSRGAQGVWRADVTASDLAEGIVGERSLLSPRACGALAEPLALVVATFLGAALEPGEAPSDDPDAGSAPEAGPDAAPELPELPEPARAEPTLAPAPGPEPVRSRLRPPITRATRPLSLGAPLGLALESGLLPGPGVGLTAGLVLVGEDFALDLGVLAFPRVSEELPGRGEARFDAELARLAACASAWQSAHLRLEACLGLRGGRLGVRTRGLADVTRAQAPFAAAELSARLSARVSPALRAYLSLSALLPLYVAHFYYEDADLNRVRYHTTEPGVGLGLGVIAGPAS